MRRGGKQAVAARVKVIDLAKELGVTSKDLIVALEAMGQKAMRAMSPLPAATANELRIKLGRGRDLPEETKPKRAAKAKPTPAESKEPAVAKKSAGGSATAQKGARKEVVTSEAEPPLAPPPVEEIKPAATLFRHTAAPVGEPMPAPAPAAEPTPAAPPPAPTVPRKEPTLLRPTAPTPAAATPARPGMPPAAVGPAAPPRRLTPQAPPRPPAPPVPARPVEIGRA